MEVGDWTGTVVEVKNPTAGGVAGTLSRHCRRPAHDRPRITPIKVPRSTLTRDRAGTARATAVQSQGERRILQYVGRATPMIKRGSKWEDLDAVTVFDWE